MKAALLLVDIQNDFLPGGSLSVPEGDQVIAPTLALTKSLQPVFATQDWHPSNHGSFASNHADHQIGDQIQLDGLTQILWPTHCVQGTPGAEFAAELQTVPFSHVSRKGVNPEVDSYSGFFDNARRETTDLHQALQNAGVDTLYVGGLATEYCVKFTVLDALSLGYRTVLVQDACRGLDDESVAAAVAEMRIAGAEIATSQAILASDDPASAPS